nr:hypothetical protein [Bacilli bacterium]
MTVVTQSAVLLIIVLLGVWLYGFQLSMRLSAYGVKNSKGIGNRFRLFASAILFVAIVIGTLHLLHVISMMMSIIFYIPIVIGFIIFMVWLQKYLRVTKEDSNHE